MKMRRIFHGIKQKSNGKFTTVKMQYKFMREKEKEKF